MTTTEHELQAPVDLCTRDGRRLAPDAVGWSRRPLHRANLAGWGRTKRWDYWALLSDDLVVAVTCADIDYLGLASVWWLDVPSGRTGGQEVVVPLARGVHLPDVSGDTPVRVARGDLEVELRDDAGGTTLRARWREGDGRPGRLDAQVTLPPNHESVNVVIPWSQRRFQYTSKHQARPATGTLTVGDDRRRLGGETGEAWGVLDVGRGRWPYRTRWNWGGGAGHAASGEVVGLQLGGRWTAGTGYTENGVIVDGRVVKLGEELAWSYDWDAPLQPWQVRSGDGRLDVTLTPHHDRHDRTDALLVRTEVHQVFGTWAGTVPTPTGGTLTLDHVVGFAEESRSRW